MEWRHRCSLEWMRQRQQFLTASDVKALLPVTRTGRPRKVTYEDRLKVLAGKMVELTEEDCVSTGAAARGHILEPYAIDVLNELCQRGGGRHGIGTGERFYHWDDAIVAVPTRSLAFSPDAMDVPMGASDYTGVTAIAEVKSYSAERHIATAYTDPKEVEERWQIATAMAVLEQIDHAYLVLFNPRMRHQKTYVHTYQRCELSDEIDMVLEVEKEWDSFRKGGPIAAINTEAVSSYLGGNEARINAEVLERQRLNPV